MSSIEFSLAYTENAEDDLKLLAADKGKKVAKYDEMEGPNGEDVFESYAQNNTPGAYRIFWHYGPGKNKITILAITPHP